MSRVTAARGARARRRLPASAGWRAAFALVYGLAAGAAGACAVRPGDVLFTREPTQEAQSSPAIGGPDEVPPPVLGAPAAASTDPGGPRITIAREDAGEPAGHTGAGADIHPKGQDGGGGVAGAASPARGTEPASAAAEPPSVSADSGYVLGEEDVIEIAIVGEPEFAKVPARIGPRGTVELPYAGEIQAAGSTVEKFRRLLESRLNEYFVNPQVTVYLREYRSPMVHVLGEVARPGPYKLTHSNTLMEVISRAGGFTQLAARGKVKVIRKTPGAPEKMFTVDAAQILDKGRVELDVALAPGDIIIVPESFL